MSKAPKPPKPVDGPTACRAFGLAVRLLRGKLAMSQEEFAFRCGIQRAHMNTIEMGRCNLTLEIMMRLLPVLGVSFGKLADTVDGFLSVTYPRKASVRKPSKKKALDIDAASLSAYR